MQTSNFHVCVPKTQEHRRGMKWFSALTRVVEEKVPGRRDAARCEDPVSLQHSIQLYSVYVETGDSRYLALCEDFLKYSLTLPSAATRR
jgi:hypothetical protein